MCVTLAGLVWIQRRTAHLVALGIPRSASIGMTVRGCVFVCTSELEPKSAAHRTNFKIYTHGQGPHLRLCHRPGSLRASCTFVRTRLRESDSNTFMRTIRVWAADTSHDLTTVPLTGVVPPAVQGSTCGSESLFLFRWSLHPVHCVHLGCTRGDIGGVSYLVSLHIRYFAIFNKKHHMIISLQTESCSP